VAITGATGFIGRRLVQVLVARGGEVFALTRDPARALRSLPEGVELFTWDPMAGPPPADALQGLDAVVHLAGESVRSPRWIGEQKRRIRESRVVGTRNLVEGLAAAAARPRVLVSGSGVDYYGDRGDERLDEGSPPGRTFLAQLAVDWEAEASRAEALGVRVVLFRSSLVLGPHGGVLSQLSLPFKLGLGATFGTGRQWLPWIQLEDEVGLILHALEREEISGPLIAAAPNPATNAEFTRALARALSRPAFFVIPTLVCQLAMGGAGELLLASRRTVPTKALATGYRFVHPELQGALAASLAG
jgi:uncharacterized protein (TIGR01777 family)